jgi:hypothetical protein
VLDELRRLTPRIIPCRIVQERQAEAGENCRLIPSCSKARPLVANARSSPSIPKPPEAIVYMSSTSLRTLLFNTPGPWLRSGGRGRKREERQELERENYICVSGPQSFTDVISATLFPSSIQIDSQFNRLDCSEPLRRQCCEVLHFMPLNFTNLLANSVQLCVS